MNTVIQSEDLSGSSKAWLFHLLSTFCAGGLLFVALYHLAETLFNLFLHPLRRFPGPPLARISRLWSRIGNFQGCKSERIHQAHLEYGGWFLSESVLETSSLTLLRTGPVVRVGPNELSFADPAAVRDIYTSEKFIKDEKFYVGH